MERTKTADRPKVTPLYKDGHRVTIRGMEATSIRNNHYQVSTCEGCGMFVAWAQNKAGKWYVCNTAQYSTEGGYERFRAMPYAFHDCATAQPPPPKWFFVDGAPRDAERATDLLHPLAIATELGSRALAAWIVGEK